MQEPKLFKNHDFKVLFNSNCCSTIGDVMFSVSIGIWIFKLTQSTALMGLFSSISSLSSIFVAPFAAKLIDYCTKKYLIVLTDFIRGLVLIVSSLLISTISCQTSLFFVISLIVALCNSLFNPSMTVAFSFVVKQEYYLKMNSLNSAIESSISLIGSSIFTALALSGNLVFALMLNGGLFIIAGLFTLLLQDKLKFNIANTKQQLSKQSALLYILNNKTLKQGYLYVILFNFFVVGLSSLYLPFFMTKGFPESSLSIFLLMGGLGSLLGSFILAIIDTKKAAALLHKRNFILTRVFFIFMICSQTVFLSTVLYFISSFFTGLCNTVINTQFLQAIDKNIRGQIISYQISFFLVSKALSTIFYGSCSQLFLISEVALFLNIIQLCIILFYYKKTTFFTLDK